MFIGLFSLLWIVFFSVHLPFSPPATIDEAEDQSDNLAVYSVQYSWWYVVGGVILFVFVIALLVLTFSRYYSKLALPLALLLALLLMVCSCALALALNYDRTADEGFSTISFVAQFAITAVVILIIFTLSRLHIVVSIVLSVIYVTVLEALAGTFTYHDYADKGAGKVYIHSTIARALFYVCLLLAATSIAYISQLRLHATFWKIAQCVLSQKALDLERELEEKTILSTMPKPFANELLHLHVQLAFMVKQGVGLAPEEAADPILQSLSTPFAVCAMDRVSILFADIVDFTEFSSSLSAADLVGILNEVFSEFDQLVTKHKCEKISTLGDCYFCVSGCPEAMINHADNCVDMGLAIVDALDTFRKKTQLPIEMRIGIHTGSVFCGVMGTRKFKFDVWSRDVTIASKIESVSTPGRVMISSATRNTLTSAYVVEEANIHQDVPELQDTQLYYVVGRRSRALSMGTSVMEWRRKIHTIDTVFKVESNQESIPGSPQCHRYLCLPWRKEQVVEISTPGSAEDARSMHSSGSIVDIFSKQTQLQRCTSYADIANPTAQQQSIVEHQIVDLMKEQQVDIDTYFNSQLKIFSLQFHDQKWEDAYRSHGRDIYDGLDEETAEKKVGFQITKWSIVLSTVILFIEYLLVMGGSIVCLSSSKTFLESIWISWLAVFLFGLVVNAIILVHAVALYVPQWFPRRFGNWALGIVNWYVRTLVALFMIYYPMSVVFVSIARCQGDGIESEEGLAHVQMSFFVTIVVLVSSINFMAVSHIVKVVAGFLSAIMTIVMVVVIHLNVCVQKLSQVNITTVVSTLAPGYPEFTTDTPRSYLTNYYTRHLAPEAIILLLLILILLTVVNRMYEVSVRLSFISRVEAAERRRSTRQRKIQAEWLLYNIIPPHVAFELRKTGKFSRNHQCVGVIFATIVNFNSYYEQQECEHGEQSLRLLNQIVSEFDALLDKPQYPSTEKIKTIGSTYMAASGLNLPLNQPCTVDHLVELIDFAQQLIEVLESINQRIPGLGFRMRIGFNYGPVTSGVVGRQKMLYDIWGDAVNVASRMDSTGKVGKIHMPEHCLEMLAPYVRSEFHRITNIKGKGEMKTFFVTVSRNINLLLS